VTAPRLTARVEDATLVRSGGPARLALANLPHAASIANAVAAARGVSDWVAGRLVITVVPSRLIDAAGRVGGEPLADLVRRAVEPAIAAWSGEAPDVRTSSGLLPSSTRPIVMGVLNATPDSFSDGGGNYDPTDHPATAIAAGHALVAAGADLVDVGGESTRPGAPPIGVDDELARVLPVVAALASAGVIVSIDTTKAVVARAAVEAGAAIVNDVSAGSLDPELLPTVAELAVPYVLTHMQGTPRTMQKAPSYGDVVGDVFDTLAGVLDELRALGVAEERVVVDPGIGFGKTVDHNLLLLHRIRELTSLGRPVMVGTSRKSFIGRLTDTTDVTDRLEGSLVTAALAVSGGASFVRVHDVEATVRAVRVAHAVRTASTEPDAAPPPSADDTGGRPHATVRS
jgi:dihydropteroate synthase